MDRRSVQRIQEALSNRIQFHPCRGISPGDDDPTSINDNHTGRRKGGEELIGFGKPPDRPAQLQGARGFPLHSGKDKMASLRS